ncbi:malate dehydrogenase [Andrena cerasifolii]|uniref:malate dehydrogenase n=1 Tax=Andrena cerasifolii TaxID=2819439 RepID=UPI004038007B
MDPSGWRKGESVVTNISRRNDDLRLVVTDASTDLALTLIYRILSDDVFGTSRSIFVSLFEFRDKAVFLESVGIELTSFSPNLLTGVTYSSDASVAFKDADVVICIGSAREYTFGEEDYNDPFFVEHGESIEAYAKRDARVVAMGSMAATIIATYAKSIPIENITAPVMFNLKMVAAQIATRAKCLATEVKNLIVWGNNNKHTFPDCRYISLPTGRTLCNKMKVWLRNSLPRIMTTIANRPSYLRSIAYGMADHCKLLWHGTPQDEWTCMLVSSDHSYDVRAGIFFSYPVICRNKRCEIVQGLCDDEYVANYILYLSRLIARDFSAATKILSRDK